MENDKAPHNNIGFIAIWSR